MMKTQFLLLSGRDNLKVTELNSAKTNDNVSKISINGLDNQAWKISGNQVEIWQKAFLELDYANCTREINFIQQDNSVLYLKIPIIQTELNSNNKSKKLGQEAIKPNLGQGSKNIFLNSSKIPLESAELNLENPTRLNLSQLARSKYLEINIWQVGEKCQTEVEVFGYIQQSTAIKISIWHLGPFGRSLQKSAFLVQNDLELEGKIIIKAKDCRASFDSHNLLIGTDSKAKIWPILEIFQPPQSCTHAATLSSFDQETLDYLQTRQLNPGQAKNLLAEHFLDEFLD